MSIPTLYRISTLEYTGWQWSLDTANLPMTFQSREFADRTCERLNTEWKRANPKCAFQVVEGPPFQLPKTGETLDVIVSDTNTAATAFGGPCTYCGDPNHWRPDCPEIAALMNHGRLRSEIDEWKLAALCALAGIVGTPEGGYRGADGLAEFKSDAHRMQREFQSMRTFCLLFAQHLEWAMHPNGSRCWRSQSSLGDGEVERLYELAGWEVPKAVGT